MYQNKRSCILQVEDEEADITLLQYAFKKAEIHTPIQVVTDGQMAIDYLSGVGRFENRHEYPLPFLIILDIKMPKLSGLEVLAWLRKQPGLKHIVVVVFSSSAQPEDVRRAYELGGNSFVQKPPDPVRSIEFAKSLKTWWLMLNCFVEKATASKG